MAFNERSELFAIISFVLHVVRLDVACNLAFGFLAARVPGSVCACVRVCLDVRAPRLRMRGSVRERGGSSCI